MNKHQHIIQLSRKEFTRIQSIIRRGKHGTRVITRARILLLSHRGKSKDAIVAELEITRSTVQDVRNRYREGRLGRSLYDAPRPGQPPTLDDTAEAYLVAIACSEPPQGTHHWTRERLQKRMIEDKQVNTISTVALWKHLKNRGIKPWREKNVVHPDAHA
jgi:putative transposase